MREKRGGGVEHQGGMGELELREVKVRLCRPCRFTAADSSLVWIRVQRHRTRITHEELQDYFSPKNRQYLS